VEESAAAAESLKEQAHRMTTVVAGYRVESGMDIGFAAAPKHQAAATKAIAKAAAPAAKPLARPVAVARPAAPKLAAPTPAPAPIAAPAAVPAAPAAAASDDWESF